MKFIIFLFLIYLISCNVYELNMNREIVYSQLGDAQRIIRFNWNEFNIRREETIIRFQVSIFTKKTKIGFWQGAFSTSTCVPPTYWYMSGNMQQELNNDEGLINWDVPGDIGHNILCQDNPVLDFGIWWIDCDSFTIKSIIITTA